MTTSAFRQSPYNDEFHCGDRTLPNTMDPHMPKQKTHKGTKKRFRLTAKGKIKHRQAGTSHLQSRMSKKRRRQLRGTDTLRSNLDTKRLTMALAGNSY
jgi:large subunit ribosomal protein L35